MHDSNTSDWVLIGSLHDADAEIITSLFETQGIPALIQGRNHRRMLGFVGSYIQLRLLVPADRADEGRALLQDYFERRDADAYEDGPITPDQLSRPLLFSHLGRQLGLSLLISAFIGFGLASLLAGAWPLTLILAPLQLLTLFPDLIPASFIAYMGPETTAQFTQQGAGILSLVDLGCAWSILLIKAISSKSSQHEDQSNSHS